MSKDENAASRRQFLLYWVGFSVIVLGAVSILMTISRVLIDVLSYRCWYPILSPIMGVTQRPNATQAVMVPYNCSSPMVAVVRFVFNLIAELVLVGAGSYMTLNGKRS